MLCSSTAAAVEVTYSLTSWIACVTFHDLPGCDRDAARGSGDRLPCGEADHSRIGGSHQPRSLEADVPVPTDDDVVVNGDAERLGDIDDRLGHADVGLRGRRVARRVVVEESAMID